MLRRPYSQLVYISSILFCEGAGQQSVVFPPNRAIALARCAFQKSPVQYRDDAAAVCEDLQLLKLFEFGVYRYAANNQHFGQELLREVKLITVDTVVTLQQPSSATLAERMAGVASNGLHHLSEERT